MASQSNTLSLYIDGVLQQTSTQINSGISPLAETVAIGARATNDMFFDGSIDEVKIYNRALSSQEIKADYNIGSQINPGQIADMKIYNSLAQGKHTLKLCTSSACNTAILTIF